MKSKHPTRRGTPEHVAYFAHRKQPRFIERRRRELPIRSSTHPCPNVATKGENSLDIEQIPFTDTDGNCQGYARKRQIAINPVAQLPHKTLFHEAAHVILGHTTEADFTDTERTPKNRREVEAEAVAMLCCEALNLEGADYCRGYIQNWLCPALGYNGDAIPEKSAQKILRSADQILRAGRLQPEQAEEQEQ